MLTKALCRGSGADLAEGPVPYTHSSLSLEVDGKSQAFLELRGCSLLSCTFSVQEWPFKTPCPCTMQPCKRGFILSRDILWTSIFEVPCLV